jgi:hypothetical protein
MKFILKRRKHRKGIRPKRKGTLKVNMSRLPTYDEHYQNLRALLIWREKHANLIEAFEHLKAGNRAAVERIIRLSKHTGRMVDSMQKGFNYFREHRQMNPTDLALRAINEVNPVYNGKRASACDKCEKRSNCPFTGYSSYTIDMVCPIRRRAYVNLLMKVMNDEPTEAPLTQSDMANLAVKHLS